MARASQDSPLSAVTSPTQPAIAVRTEGQRMLLAVTGTLQAIGDEVGAKAPTIHEWRNGRKLPSIAARARIWTAFGIPVRAWTLRPGGQDEPPPPSAAVDASAPVQSEILIGTPSTLDDCLALLNVIRRDRMQQNLMPQERVKLADAEARILTLRSKLEQAAEFSEARYVTEHPSWLRLRKAVVTALEPFPEAAIAVTAALAKLERPT